MPLTPLRIIPAASTCVSEAASKVCMVCALSMVRSPP